MQHVADAESTIIEEVTDAGLDADSNTSTGKTPSSENLEPPNAFDTKNADGTAVLHFPRLLKYERWKITLLKSLYHI